MNNEDWPALYRSADQSSNSAQKTYLSLIRLQYAVLISAALFSVFIGDHVGWNIAYVLSLFLSSIFLVYLATSKPEQSWYKSRALAESVKTATWRFMMRADPFEDQTNVHSVKGEFSSFLQDILKANNDVGESVKRKPDGGPQITVTMLKFRALPIGDRVQRYMRERVEEQRTWYVKKSTENVNYHKIWVAISVILQAIAIVLALLRIQYGVVWTVWPIDALLVAASAAIGWMQVKKFNELASAYALTAHEISLVEAKMSQITTEGEVSEFVNEAERAFSREHTQWVARQTEAPIV